MYSLRRIHGMSSPRDVCCQVTVVLSGHRELICILGTPYGRIRLFRWSFLAGNNWNAVPVAQWCARALGFRFFGMERSLETQAQNLLFPEYSVLACVSQIPLFHQARSASVQEQQASLEEAKVREAMEVPPLLKTGDWRILHSSGSTHLGTVWNIPN
uniref:Uncharacterized protein n=1 Tax=Coccidioides posadasii RMSCC 3488 TaxID=454284 RepID=A0A0J6F2P5_COCPO|nr:hypothetical protein CPAG_00739 [Coccidioides posadasii RMSCC 3488]